METLEAVFSNIEQRGPKPLRDDLVAARFLEWVPVTADDLLAGPISLGGHGRTRILGEVPLSGGSLFLEVPADIALRVQFLNADGMAVGAQHNRWIHVAPGEKFPGGVTPELYPSLCAGCHGSFSGAPGDAGGTVPDVVTAASVTLATHENMNPERPLDPVPLGDAPLVIDFRADVRPLLERSCAVSGCHTTSAAAGGLSLEATPTADFDTAYEALLEPGLGSGGGRKYVTRWAPVPGPATSSS